MIQAIGLTSVPRRRCGPVVDDLTFEARPGQVTALLGADSSGKTTALRLLLQLERGRGVALFRGRPLKRIPNPVREIGVLLGDVPGHPGRTASGHLRMLAAVAGVPAERADDLLDVVGLSGLAHQRLGSFSLGMDRRLGMAAALLGDPHTLVLDEPARGLSPREGSWLHGLLREYAEQGGAVLITLRDPREAGRTADRVVTIDGGRLQADQEAADFARTRLRPRVVVTSPHAGRLATLLRGEAGLTAGSGPAAGAEGPLEIVWEGGSRLRVYGSSCAAVGEAAYRHGILVHQLAAETGEAVAAASAPRTPLARADGRRADARTAAVRPAESGDGPAEPVRPVKSSHPAGPGDADDRPGGAGPGDTPADAPAGGTAEADALRAHAVTGPPRFSAVPRPGPAAPLRYELHRFLGISVTWYVLAVALLAALLPAVGLAAAGAESYDPGRPPPLLTGLPAAVSSFPLTPAALAAGVLGALAFGQECRYPALAPAQTPVPRRIGLLVAKLSVAACTSVTLCLVTGALNAVVLSLLFGSDVLMLPPEAPALPALALPVLALTVGCAWAGLLAAAITRSTAAGLAGAIAVPALVTPVVRELLAGSVRRSFDGLPARLESVFLVSWRSEGEGWPAVALRLLSQPAGMAVVLSAAVLGCGYVLLLLRGRWRRRLLPPAAAGGGSNTASQSPP
ncbi:ATP-binding cassette domain-containing protein [Streptomyces sp. N2-109]|uniref:ATP-binding cassette domain-containing protein n=1 Tax=Streptomyces gossypii TaxID=2883101 RepID=A0ABT2JTM6_9ACTN|nr:ATP-binding cassette domain-containing protein [Streptomyces gossypii]MCT2590619.1 ATP-binding cassette domain-containing protein [Streptomyces gossypii]